MKQQSLIMNRYYNGCPDTELQAFIDARANAQKKMETINPKARCVYFPMEQRYSVWLENKRITDYFVDKLSALNSAIELLEKR